MKCLLATLILFLMPGQVLAVPSDWADESVKSCYRMNIMPPYFAQDFQAPLKRAELAEIVIRSIERYFEFDEAPQTPFLDTDSLYAAQCFYFGIMTGNGNGFFYPESTVTREQAAAVFVRTIVLFQQLNENVVLSQAPLRDIDLMLDPDEISDYFLDSMRIAYANRIIRGHLGYLRPLDEVTREEALIIALKANEFLDRSIEEADKTINYIG